jgi:trans-aconitate methyltransferase
VTAIEPGAGMAALARQRLAAFPDAGVENSTFEEWDDGGRRFDVLVAASAWHWVDPSIGWRRAHEVLHPGEWMALLGNVVVDARTWRLARSSPGDARAWPFTWGFWVVGAGF